MTLQDSSVEKSIERQHYQSRSMIKSSSVLFQIQSFTKNALLKWYFALKTEM